MSQREDQGEETRAGDGAIISISVIESLQRVSREDDTQEVPLVKNLAALPYRTEKEQAVGRGSPAVWFTRLVRRVACR
jgi:hypothetical protein